MEHVDLAVRGVEKHPLPYVELSAEVEHWLLYQLLNDECKVFHLLFLLFFIPLVPLVMVMVVCLENRRLISSASSNTIVVTHDVSQLVKCLEDMDSNASISRCRLQHPQVLVVVAAVCQFIWSFQSFFFLGLALIQLLINNINILVNILINQFHYTQELFYFVTHIIFQVV